MNVHPAHSLGFSRAWVLLPEMHKNSDNAQASALAWWGDAYRAEVAEEAVLLHPDRNNEIEELSPSAPRHTAAPVSSSETTEVPHRDSVATSLAHQSGACAYPACFWSFAASSAPGREAQREELAVVPVAVVVVEALRIAATQVVALAQIAVVAEHTVLKAVVAGTALVAVAAETALMAAAHSVVHADQAETTLNTVLKDTAAAAAEVASAPWAAETAVRSPWAKTSAL